MCRKKIIICTPTRHKQARQHLLLHTARLNTRATNARTFCNSLKIKSNSRSYINLSLKNIKYNTILIMLLTISRKPVKMKFVNHTFLGF